MFKSSSEAPPCNPSPGLAPALQNYKASLPTSCSLTGLCLHLSAFLISALIVHLPGLSVLKGRTLSCPSQPPECLAQGLEHSGYPMWACPLNRRHEQESQAHPSLALGSGCKRPRGTAALKPTHFLDTYRKGETKCEPRQRGLRFTIIRWDLRLQGT